jgi:hypothetical protein
MGFKVPQTNGLSGWLLLSYLDSKPVCVWTSGRDEKIIPCCISEKLFGDTLFKAEFINGTYIICDVFMYNSCCIFACSTFQQRYEWIPKLMNRFFKNIPGLPTIIHKSVIGEQPIKGYEIYTDVPGSKGFYIENSKTLITKSEIPDVYFISGTENYIQVPNIKTSSYLRSLGDSFELELEEQDGLWLIKENIPDIE